MIVVLWLCGSDSDYTDSHQKEWECLKIQFSLWKKLGLCNIILEKNLSTFLRFCLMIKKSTTIGKNGVKIIGLLIDLFFYSTQNKINESPFWILCFPVLLDVSEVLSTSWYNWVYLSSKKFSATKQNLKNLLSTSVILFPQKYCENRPG